MKNTILFSIAFLFSSLGFSQVNCNADFTSSTMGNSAYFTNTSSGTFQYYWDFGDGNVSSSTDPNHTYSTGGTYLVCLTAIYNDSINFCSDTACYNVTVVDSSGGSSCNADFSFSTSGSNAYFTNSSAGSFLFYSWDFGDGSTSNDENPSNSYTVSGDYLVCLTIWDSISSCTSTHCDTVSIVADSTGGTSCNADFSFSTSGSNAYFTNSSAGSFLFYSWDFGDGSTSNDENPSNSYTVSGDYLVCLTIWDSISSCTSTHCDTVSIAADSTGGTSCNAQFTVNSGTGFASFTNTSAGSSLFYSWDFGDGSTSYDENPTNYYSSTGEYFVCLTIWDSITSCTSTYCDSIYISADSTTAGIFESETLDFMVYPNPSKSVVNVSFNGNISGSIRVTDLMGREMKLLPILTSSSKIDVSAFPKGVYLIQVIDNFGNKVGLKKFIRD